jgi:uncharacterized protein YqgV (UPF0045/DUF77 family)
MGVADLFGFGKKRKESPFKIPGEVSALRTRIDAENSENFPSLTRYREIVKNAREIYAQLDALGAQTEYAVEAVRIKEDIRKKIEWLSDKINKNRKEARKEGSPDYVASNMEYLERKGMRNQAKTLFTECLDNIDTIATYFREERLKNGTTIESSIDELIKAMSALHNDFFKEYGDDKEIKGIRERLLKKIADLNAVFEENRGSLKASGLDARTQARLSGVLRVSGRTRG